MDNATSHNVDGLTVNQTPEQTFLSPLYEYPKGRIDQLIRSWDTEFKLTDYRRRARNITVNVNELRKNGNLKPDETIIPIRLIDTNIKREEAPKIAYIKQSKRLAIFKPKNRSKILNVDVLEAEFTRVSQYPGWELDYIKVIDGAATHGWDAVEICYDDNLPGKFCVDHIGHENLVFPLDAINLDACEAILRIRRVTCSQLRRFVQKFGFDPLQAEKVLQSTDSVKQNNVTATQNVPIEDSQREIGKLFFKQDGIVYVAWWAKECDGWLKKPEPLFLGKKETITEIVEQLVPVKTGTTPYGQDIIENVPTQIPQQKEVPVYETKYPVKILIYEENEQTRIKDKRGRVDKDDYKQEALMAIWSSFVNGCLRASNVHAAPKNSTSGAAAPKQTNVIIEHGKMWNEPIDFFNTPWPDPMILHGAQALDIQNTQETLQLSAAVSNRKDSRKTAEEIKSVTQEQSLIGGVQVTLLSIFMREILNYVWPIVQSQALQSKIVFCSIEMPPGSKEYTNNLDLIQEEYDIFAAGDVDVIERKEKVNLMLQTYPIYANTPLGMEFLIELTKLLFPDMAERFETILRTGFAQQLQMAQLQQMMGGGEQPQQQAEPQAS
jgi:hypothetical protein